MCEKTYQFSHKKLRIFVSAVLTTFFVQHLMNGTLNFSKPDFDDLIILKLIKIPQIRYDKTTIRDLDNYPLFLLRSQSKRNTLIEDWTVRSDCKNFNFDITAFPFFAHNEITFANNLHKSRVCPLSKNKRLDVVQTENFQLQTSDFSDIDIRNECLNNSYFDLNLSSVSNVYTDKNSSKKKSALPATSENHQGSVHIFDVFNRFATHPQRLLDEQETMTNETLYKQDVDLGYSISNRSSPSILLASTQTKEEAEKIEAIQTLKETMTNETLYKQDVDLGYSISNRSSPYVLPASTQTKEEAEKIEAIQTLKNIQLTEEALYQQDIDLGYFMSYGTPEGPSFVNNISKKRGLDFADRPDAREVDKRSKKLEENVDDDGWAGIPFKIDNETGEFIRLPLEDLFKDILPIEENRTIEFNEQKGSCHSSQNMDSKVQDIANLFTPVHGFYSTTPEIVPYTHYHAHHSQKNNPNTYASRQNQLPNLSQREDIFYQNNLTVGLETTGSLGLSSIYANGETNSVKNSSNTSTDLIQNDAFLSSFLNEDCIRMIDTGGNERSQSILHNTISTMDSSNAEDHEKNGKRINITSSMCSSNVTERMDLSCDSAVSSISSERLQTNSDSEWVEGSGSGNDYYTRNSFYGPYDYSSNTRNFNTRQVSAAQKKYHMFGKRFLQEESPENEITHSKIHILHSQSSISECERIESSAFDGFGEESQQSLKATNNKIRLNIKCERNKFKSNIFRTEVNNDHFVRHNHTYALVDRSVDGSRYVQNNSNYKSIQSEGNLSRDEKRARNLNVPIPVVDIINLPMDEFNERISKYELSENQLSLIRDIRRRGKNKVAAQNCRKRKLDTIISLEGEVREVRRRKDRLDNDRSFIASEKKRIANKFAALHQHIFQFLRDAEGNPCSPSKFSLQQASDGSMYLLPRENSKLGSNCYMSVLMSEVSSSK